MRLSFSKLLQRVLAIFMSLLVLGTSASYVYAATVSSNNTAQSGNNGLQISPTRTDLTIDPGQATTFQISIKNVSSISLIAKVTLNDFESDNQTGTPKLLINPSQHSPRSIRSYLSGLSDITLQPAQTENIQLVLSVPKNVSPGGYYGAVRYSAVPVNPKENVGPSQVSLTASVATLVLMEINGPVNETLTLDSINAQRHGSNSTFFFGHGPDAVSIKLTNQGNGFSQPIGHVYVNKGGNQIASYEFNSNNIGLHSTVLPDSSRIFTSNIKNANAFGEYKITANIAYKQGDSTITITQRFWVIPKVYSIILVIVLIAIAAGVYFLTRRRSGGKSRRNS